MEYLEILNRIVEIIYLSSEKKNIFESQKNFDGNEVDINSKKFFVFYPYYIFNEYYEEFEYLRSKELTYFNLSTDSNAGLKNQILIKECQNYISNNPSNSSECKEIINIINRCNGKLASELVYVMGYYVCDDDLCEFKKLCNKFRLGLGKSICNNEAEMYDQIKISNKQIECQKRRIEKHMKFLNNENPNVINVDYDNEKQSENRENLDTFLTHKYKEFIYLGMLGYLNINMVANLKNVMSNDEFSELLNDLKMFNVFSHDELLDIGIEANQKVKL